MDCAHGDKRQDPVTGWWEFRFEAPFDTFPGCAGVSGNVTSISILFNEGNDLALVLPNIGLSPGNVILDNIGVNDRVVGKPTGSED